MMYQKLVNSLTVVAANYICYHEAYIRWASLRFEKAAYNLLWGGEHMAQCTDDMLQNFTPETYIIL